MTEETKVQTEEVKEVEVVEEAVVGKGIPFAIKDRLIISLLYPKESDLITQILVKDLRAKLDFTQKEITDLGFKVTKEGYQWNQKGEKVTYIEFTDKEIKLLQDGVKTLDEEKKISQDNLDLCKKIQDFKVV